MFAVLPESTASTSSAARAARLPLGLALAGSLLLSASCAMSAEVPPLPDASGTDAGRDAGRDAGFDAGSAPTCSPPSGTTFTCGGTWSTPWFITTTNGSLNGTLQLTSAVGDGFGDCPRDFTVRWNAAPLGRAGVTSLVLHVHESSLNTFLGPVSVDGTSNALACSIQFQAANGSVVTSIPCRFDGCFGQDATTHANVFSGRVRASSGGIDIDTTFAVPMCTVTICL